MIPAQDAQWLRHMMGIHPHDESKPLGKKLVEVYFVVRNMRTRQGLNLNAPMEDRHLELAYCLYKTDRIAVKEDADEKKLREATLMAKALTDMQPGDPVEVLFRDEWRISSLVSKTEKQVRVIIEGDVDERSFNLDRIRFVQPEAPVVG